LSDLILAKRAGRLSVFTGVSSKASNYYGHLDNIITLNEPFSIVDNATYRLYSKLEPMTRTTLMTTIRKVTAQVTEKITNALPEKFGLVFDGWTSPDKTHYVGMFAIYNKDDQVCRPLLAISPLLDETDQSAESYDAWIVSTLNCFKKSMDNVLYLSSDNCSTNLKIARVCSNKEFVGCHSHRLNLAVNEFMEVPERKSKVDIVHAIMKKCRKTKNLARIRNIQLELEHSQLRLIINNDTRWSSKFEMIKRFVTIFPDTQIIQDQILVDLIPTPKVLNEIKVILK
jgi:hypothetical protein